MLTIYKKIKSRSVASGALILHSHCVNQEINGPKTIAEDKVDYFFGAFYEQFRYRCGNTVFPL